MHAYLGIYVCAPLFLKAPANKETLFPAAQTGKHLLKKQNVSKNSQKQMFPVRANGETFRETTIFPRLRAPLDNGNSRVYCINESIIATYFNNKNGFLYAVCFFTFLPPLIFVSVFPSLSSPQFLDPGFFSVSFFIFYFGPQPYLEPSPLDQIWIISLCAIPLHHRS